MLEKVNPEGPWFKPLLGVGFIVLGPLVIAPLFMIPMALSVLKLQLRLVLGMDLPSGTLTFDDICTSMTPEDCRSLRQKHWLDDEKWAELIRSVVSEVFSTAEVEDGTVNPLRLNSEGRMRWLCERSLQSTRGEAETKAEVAKIDGVMKEKVAQLEDRMDSQHAETNAKVERVETKVEAMDAKLDRVMAQQSDDMREVRAMIAQLVELQRARP